METKLALEEWFTHCCQSKLWTDVQTRRFSAVTEFLAVLSLSNR